MIDLLDRGEIRVAEVVDDKVVVQQAAKHAILMWFRVQEMKDDRGRARSSTSTRSRSSTGTKRRACGSFRARRRGSARSSRRGVVMMPSYVNIGAYVDERHDGRHLGDGGFVRADR